MACNGKPAQYLIRVKRSSSAAAMSSPSRSKQADAPAWKALIPRMYMRELWSRHSRRLEATWLGPESGSPKHLRCQQRKSWLHHEDWQEDTGHSIAIVNGQQFAHLAIKELEQHIV